MSVNRRLFLTALAGLPTLAVLKSVPAAAWTTMPGEPAVGDVWGLRYFASGATPAAMPRRGARSAVPAWHPEFC
ncbi:hypothetical protein [Aurantiacibacter flavus]|uniref:Uncharacterized protein n=1 Tax=Aurantiacibacter flavus TaxID=3145232 RepID=A0ABV0CSI7_9SPHN